MKKIYGILFILLIIFNCYNVFRILPLHNSRSSGEFENLNQAYTINYTDKVLAINEKMILVANKNESVYQCFNYNGDFLWGVKVPYTKDVGSTSYSFDSENIYIWSEPVGEVAVFNKSGVVGEFFHEDIEDSDGFYEKYPIKVENVFIKFLCKFKMNGNLGISTDKGEELLNVKLNAPFNYYTIELAVVFIVICSICCIILKKKME